VRLTRQATVLLVDDVARATEYYRDKLGFEVERFEDNPDHYSPDGYILAFGTPSD
jgi:catechol 2,3-dioxygenase-like lactoylglutathione lyase family enzyme